MSGSLRKVRQFLVVGSAVVLIAVGALFGAARALLPLASDYREELEAFIGESIDTPVQIGEMDVGWRGWRPELRLREIALIDRAGEREPLRLKEVWVGLQLGHALFAGELQLADIQLEGVQIILQREADGSISVRGLRGSDASAAAQQGEGAANALGFLLLVRRLDLVNASVVLSDVARDIEYFFPAADIRVENDGYRHRAHALLELPKALGERIEVTIDFTGDPQKPKEWLGQAYATGRSLNITEFLHNLPDQSVSVPSGVVDLTVWSQWGEGRMQSAFARVALSDFSLASNHKQSNQAPPWALENATADINWRRMDDGWDLAISKLALNQENKVWKENDLRLISTGVSDNRQFAAYGRHAPIVPVIAALTTVMGGTADADWPETLRALNPRGEIYDWRFDVQPSVGLDSLQMAAAFDQVAFAKIDNVPGISGMTGSLRSVGAELEIDLIARDLVADVEPLFRQSIRLQSLQGRIRARLGENAWRISSDQLAVDNADVSGKLRLDVRQKGDSPIQMDMQANFRDGDGKKTGQYLPVGIMATPLVEWLDRAIVSGDVERGSLLFRGALDGFPFSRHDGVFEVDFYTRDAEINYLPQWPVASGVGAKVRFYGKSLSILADRGEVAGGQVDALVGHVESLFSPVVQLEGNLRSQVKPMLVFAKEGPIRDIFVSQLGPVSGEGDAGLALRVRFPLNSSGEELTVGGGITFRDASFYHSGMDTRFSEVNGTVQFDQQSIRADNLRAYALGADLRIDVKPVASTATLQETRVAVKTVAPAANILKKLNIPIDTYISGDSEWLAILNVFSPSSGSKSGRTELVVRSDLLGTEVKLPTPLYKPADQASEFELAVQVAGPDPFEFWKVRYGDVGAASIGIKDGLKLGVMLGGVSADLPKVDGFELRGRAKSLDIDSWQVLLKRITQSTESQSEQGFNQRILAQLAVDHLAVSNKLISDIVLVVDTSDDGWRLGMDSDTVRGSVRIERPFDLQSPLEINLEHLDYDKLAASTINGEAKPTTILPVDIPPFTFTSSELVWSSYLFKNVKAVGKTTARGLVLNPVSVDNESLKMRGNGLWSYYPDAQRHRSSLTLEFSSESLQTALADLRQDGLVAEGNGYVDIELYWPDAIFLPTLENIKGDVKIVLKQGRILAIDPGAGRLLGLLALNQLPRRLRFDFKDALRGGMEFDEIAGGLVISDGVANTDLVRVRGPVGVIDIAGSADFVKETYDQRIVVLPRVGASLPLLGVLSGGLGAGLAIFVSDNVLKNLGINLDAMGRREYTLKGHWDDPELKDVTPSPVKINNAEKER